MLGQLNILSFRAMDNRLKTFVESHNNLNEGLSDTIRISRKSALRNIVNAYRNFICTYRNYKDWETSTTIPEMKINRNIISKMVGCCEKTAYNHIMFLIEAGVCVKQLHGRQNDFGLYLNPYFWLMECEKLPNLNLKNRSQETTFSLSLSNFLPPISIQEFQEINNYYKADVETVDKVSWSNSNTTPPQFQSSTVDMISRKSIEQTVNLAENKSKEPQTPKKEVLGAVGGLSTELSTNLSTLGDGVLKVVQKLEKSSNTKDKSNGTTVGGNGTSVMTSDVAPQSSTPNENEQEAWSLVKKLTDYTLRNIYQSGEFNKNFFISATQYSEIQQLIMANVFNNFQNATNDVWKFRQVYTDGVLAIDKAITHARNNNWSSFIHPKVYFSKAYFNQGNKNSFFTAYKWQVEDKHKLQEIKKDDFLEKAKHHVRYEKSPRGRKDLTTRLQISVHFKALIAKRCGAMHVSMFNNFLANPNNF